MLGVLWWAWAAYAWLTNTINPEEGAVRIAMFGAMGAMLIASLAVPDASATTRCLFACAYVARPDRASRALRVAGAATATCSRAIARLGVGTADRRRAALRRRGRSTAALQVAIWALALVLDLLGAYVGGGRGWRLSAGHFAERHALIVIIALGESIVALGVGRRPHARPRRDRGRAARPRRRRGDVVGLLRRRRDRRRAAPARADGRCAQLAMARDSYSYLHLPMVAGIILFAVGVKKTLGDIGDPLKLVPAVALCGGVALYLLAHVALPAAQRGDAEPPAPRRRGRAGRADPARASSPPSSRSRSSRLLAVGLIAYEAIRFADARDRVRARGGRARRLGDAAEEVAGDGLDEPGRADGREVARIPESELAGAGGAEHEHERGEEAEDATSVEPREREGSARRGRAR